MIHVAFLLVLSGFEVTAKGGVYFNIFYMLHKTGIGMNMVHAHNMH